MVTICLNMIVKNESKVILRALKSVVNLIDCFVICDTGSTDNTVDLIKEFFSSYNISGILKFTKFVNFEQARNEALNLCSNFGDYILLMDADMVLKINSFDKHKLVEDMYYMVQKSSTHTYKNTRLIKNDGSFYYKGTTHEVMLSRRNITFQTLETYLIYIEDLEDGGCKANKLTRDLKLLTESWETNKDSRSCFYLANTLFALGKFEEASKYYIERIKLKGWKEEIWYCYYRLGLCYFLFNQPDKALFYLLEAYNINFQRIENIYYIIKYYIQNNKMINAKVFYNLALQNKKVDSNFLFVEHEIYDYKLEELKFEKNELSLL